MPFISLLFILGSAFVQYFSQLPALGWLLSGCFIAMGGIRFFLARLILAFLLGLLWTSWYASTRLQVELPDDWQGESLVLQGDIIEITQQKPEFIQFVVATDTLSLAQQSMPFPADIKLSWYNLNQEHQPHNFPLKIGETWRFTVRLKKPRGFYNPGGFDYEKMLLLKNHRATGYIVNNTEPVRIQAATDYYLLRLRHYLGEKIAEQLPTSDLVGFIQALTLGLRHEISDEQWTVLQRTGTSHLMAISGLHIGLVAGLLYGIVSWSWRRSSYLMLRVATPIAAAGAGIIAAIIYSALAGFAIPTQRALVMIIVVMGAIIFRSHVMNGAVLALAAMIVLLIDPFASWSMGFWLSFGAVATIYFAIQGRLNLQTLWDKIGRTQWVVFIGLMPLTLAFFGQFSLISPLVNALAVPVAGFIIVPLALLGTLLLPFSTILAKYTLILADLSLRALWWVMETSSQWTFALVEFGAHHVVTITLALIGVIIILLPRGMPSRYIGIICLLPLFLWKNPAPKPGEFWFVLFDVGQGLSAMIRTTHHTLIYDTGDFFSDGFDGGSAVIITYFKKWGLSSIDTLLLSHQDADHTGGANSVLNQLNVQQLITSFPFEYEQIPQVLCRSGQRWSWDGVEFAILHPQSSMSKNNDNSCVLQVSTPSNRLLITGDIELLGELALVRAWNNTLKSDVLVVPHHGSLTSSSVLFINKVQPDYALYPVGYLNRFAFPKPAIVQRYEAINAIQLATDQTGMIEFVFPEFDKIHPPRLYREEEKRFWH